MVSGGRCSPSHVGPSPQYPACQWAACQGQMARKGVSCIVSTPGDGCVAGGLTSLSRPWIMAWPRPTAVSVAPYMGSVVARERVSHRVFFHTGSRLSTKLWLWRCGSDLAE